ncbi:P-loop NTPase family protein [Pragia fontium]|uniref:Replication protein n=1 Tax=Pragia fontium DSM 5563 = ATCC 49100 TaxID=1122977 RepID=A0AAJ4WB04_9GAMM|nr:hypothetical protein [Pragia fontium]SFC90652.1 putative replication protein [Pragia fontium DSM 5563 = ATCC 49100]VEJ55958.1 DNA replication protein dnaC [Pragia fontium]
MTKAFDFLARLKQAVPSHIEPKFKTADELRAWHDEQGLIASAQIAETIKQARIRTVMGRSSIQKLYENCTLDNYNAETEGQRNALTKAKPLTS